MAHEVIMPKLGMTMIEGKLIKWLKKEGDMVNLGDPVFELETDKLTNTAEAMYEGVLLKILGNEGDIYPCFAVLGVVGKPDEDISEIMNKATGATADKPAAPAQPEISPKDEPAAPVLQGGRIIASPAARKLARENGIELAFVSPSGPNGRIVLRDVEGFINSGTPARASGLAKKMAADAGIGIASIPATGRVMAADVKKFICSASSEALEERVPMSGMRATIARRMSESQSTSPTVNYVISTDMTALRETKRSLADAGISVSYTDLIVKIVAKTLPDFPNLNCTIDGEDVIYKRYVSLGVAVALEDGLLVPVVKNAHIKGLAEISAEIKSLAELAREGRITPDALSGGTFTISNLGTFGIESFTPIINQPEVAILGVNAIQDTVVAVDGVPCVRPMMKLSLTADHRVADGAVAAAFLAKVKKVIENPSLLLL